MGLTLSNSFYSNKNFNDSFCKIIYNSIMTGNVNLLKLNLKYMTNNFSNVSNFKKLNPLHMLCLSIFTNENNIFKEIVNLIINNFNFFNQVSGDTTIKFKYITTKNNTNLITHINGFEALSKNNNKNELSKFYNIRIENLTESQILTILMDLVATKFTENTDKINNNIIYLVNKLNENVVINESTKNLTPSAPPYSLN